MDINFFEVKINCHRILTHSHTQRRDSDIFSRRNFLTDGASKRVPGSRSSVAVAVDLVRVDLPPVPVSAVLRGPRAVTDCDDTHLRAEMEGEG